MLHAHQYTPFFYSALAKPLVRRPPRLIFTEHGRHFPDVVSPVRRAANRLVLDHAADAVNACCRFSGDAVRDTDGFAGRRIEIILNGIETDHYGPPMDKSAQKAKLGLDPWRRYVAHVARHHPVKDQPSLLRGFAAAAPTIPDVDLLMAGDGPLRGELEDLTRSLGIADRVKFLGIRRDVPELLKAADAFALTSVSEAASLTLLEAMATGLPCVVTAVGGNGEIVRHEKEGLLFPRADSVACGVALTRLLSNPGWSTELGANARDRVLTHYRLSQTVQAYYGLYRRLSGV
jgi:L-malate glycosyltransferase